MLHGILCEEYGVYLTISLLFYTFFTVYRTPIEMMSQAKFLIFLAVIVVLISLPAFVAGTSEGNDQITSPPDKGINWIQRNIFSIL